ncbi:MAG: integral rane sensor signal transduction histidine kinase [Mucilaginibacter sp.]|nr:integral rane sensor signal transduction histidine kinase [Mucilaginibacter sp.]
MKLFTRYNRINLPIILGIFILSGIGCYLWINHLLIADFDDSLGEQAQKIALYTHKNGNFPKPGLMDDWIITYQPNNRIVRPYYETTERYDPDDKDSSKYRTLYYTYNKDGHYYLITISKSLEALEGLSRSVAMITMITLLSVIIVTLLLSHFVLRKLWRPFYHTLNLLRDYKPGSPKTVSLSETGTEEFNFMNTRITDMIRNTEKEYAILKEFTENASHEMQTPISIIRTKLDMIVQGENLSEQQSLAMESTYQSLRRLTNLGQSLLLLSKIENNQFNSMILIDLEDKVKDKIIQLEDFWQEKQITVNFKYEAARIKANPDLIDILLNNVLSNASRHNIKKGIIDINLKQHELIVSNTGSEEPIDPERIFTRFYKQQQHSTNNGLGLAIIKQICDHSQIKINYQFIDHQHRFSFIWSI